MRHTFLLPDLPARWAHSRPEATALSIAGRPALDYGSLDRLLDHVASGLLGLGLSRGERVGIFVEKSLECVAAMFGAGRAAGVFVPVNPILKPAQVSYILQDCNVRVLVTSTPRLKALSEVLGECHDLRHVVLVDSPAELPEIDGASAHRWQDLLDAEPRSPARVVDSDVASILYTSGSTGRPKGVVLSHRNMVAGAKSVAEYLENDADDALLAALPLSFDAGFSQLSTAFHSGARVVLINYLMPRDVLKAVVRERITGLTAVPPLWIQLSQLEWPESVGEHLRYIANTGGRMPLKTLATLREQLPKVRPYLMYGLTEAFRATYLPPEEADQRPDSIGKAIPNSEILVLREDGSPCAANEPGELVQRGALVAMGYWNDPEKTAERFKPLPGDAPGREAGLVLPEIAVFSGDTVRRDEDGYLYFIGRTDEMMKTSGYRVSPTEVEEILYGTRLVGECVAFGIPHETLGQAIVAIVTAPSGAALDLKALTTECKARMPAYMVPSHIHEHSGPLPRNPNGKIDRKTLSTDWQQRHTAQ